MLRLVSLFVLFAIPAAAEPPRVVVDIAPVHALVAQVMEGVATPDLLLTRDANPHAVHLRPSQARALSDADLVVWVGPELSPWFARALEGLGVADQIVLTALPASHLREIHDDADDGHGHGAVDPHLWLSLANARAWVTVFAEALSARDPDNAAAYARNADVARTKLDALEARIAKRLAPHKGAEIITFHASMGYFADDFGIEIAGSVRASDAAPPSAAALSELAQIVADHDIRCGFAEPGYDTALLQTIARDTGLRIGVLDPVGAMLAPGPGHYAATLEAVTDAIAGCLERD